MTSPRKLRQVMLKPRAKIAPRKKTAIVPPESHQEALEILRRVVEEHRELFERLADR
jgi:hypothetical protein